MEALKKAWDFVKSVPATAWGYIVAAVVVVLYLFQKDQVEELKTELGVAEAKKTDATLAQQQADVKSQETTAQQQAEDEKKKQLTPSEIEEYLKKL